MSAMPIELLSAADFEFPAVMLTGPVDYNMYQFFRQALSNAPREGLVVVELSTLGGDPEVARMMGEDIRYHSDLHPERRIVFLGKTAIYSAGATFMGFFARGNRYLARGTRLMIHERLLTKQINLQGPLTSCIATLKQTLHEIQASIEIQNEGFQNLILGSSVTMDEVLNRATENWYLEANEAQQLGLIEAVI
ncbi:ATP-dependent protease ClpP protease subunit [Sphingomonas zeicaulis]